MREGDGLLRPYKEISYRFILFTAAEIYLQHGRQHPDTTW